MACTMTYIHCCLITNSFSMLYICCLFSDSTECCEWFIWKGINDSCHLFTLAILVVAIKMLTVQQVEGVSQRTAGLYFSAHSPCHCLVSDQSTENFWSLLQRLMLDSAPTNFALILDLISWACVQGVVANSLKNCNCFLIERKQSHPAVSVKLGTTQTSFAKRVRNAHSAIVIL